MKKLFIILSMLGLFLATTVNFAAERATVCIAGSTSMQPLVEELAQTFMTVNTGVKISVQGGGSGAGVESVQKGTADIGMCSRELKPEEKVLYRTLIAKDGIAVIVNSSNTVSNLFPSQLQKIYTGEYTNWKEVGGPDIKIYVVNREAGSGTRSAFEEIVLGKLTNTSHCLLEESNKAVQQAVGIIDEAIGYISLGSLEPAAVKMITIDNIACSKENILMGNYKVQRPFFLLTQTAPAGVIKAFIDWILGPEGQTIVAREFIRINE